MRKEVGICRTAISVSALRHKSAIRLIPGQSFMSICQFLTIRSNSGSLSWFILLKWLFLQQNKKNTATHRYTPAKSVNSGMTNGGVFQPFWICTRCNEKQHSPTSVSSPFLPASIASSSKAFFHTTSYSNVPVRRPVSQSLCESTFA